MGMIAIVDLNREMQSASLGDSRREYEAYFFTRSSGQYGDVRSYAQRSTDNECRRS
ncbi:MAG: hypothetical protein QG604_210 [Candidatus Dependentiae bacterium]|nr:hypothetical protein [Candidatus Dependentiae bacterium]